MDDQESSSVCPICKEYIYNLDHNNSVNHRFAFMKWAYNHYRKALQADRHGVVLEAEVQKINEFHFDFIFVKGKYVTKVSGEQLQLHKNKFSFNCNIKNNRQDAIYITNINLIHQSKYFSIAHSNSFGEDETTFIKLHSGHTYSFQITFSTDVLTCASYKIPLSCDFQTIDNKYNFTIVRTFLTKVDDPTDIKEKPGKSPFTSVSWKDVSTVVPSTKESRYEDKYPIPAKYIKLLTYGLEQFDGMTGYDESNLQDLKHQLEKLSKDNYNKYWHIALWLEERAQCLMLTKYNMENVTVEIKKDVLILEVPGLAEKRPSVIPGDYVRIRVTGDHTAYKGFVYRVNDKTIEISHIDEVFLEYLESDPDNPLDVSFVLGRLAYERKHRAVDTLVESGMVENLFPSNQPRIRTNTPPQLHNSQYFNQSICGNEEQKQAVNRILYNVQDLPYIVFGPPGTGKTVTIVEAILQIKKRTKKKILICAPANAACDMLAMKLIETSKCNTDELIRIHSNTRDMSTIPEKLKDYSNIEDDMFTRIFPDKLVTYRIVVTTLVLIGRFADSYRPDCVFIDEAAQASEPEADIAIALLNVGKQVVLAGDPKQLGPLTTKSAEKLGLGVSLMQRLMNCDVYKSNPKNGTYNNNFITMLRLNFRSHPDILQIPNGLFYEWLLKPMSLAAKRDPIVDIAIFPIINKKRKPVEGKAIEFCAVSSKEQREGSSPSFFNLYEMKIVVKCVEALHSLPLAEAYKVRENQIGIVTPYIRQVYKIKEALRRAGFVNVEVGTTESFQGREKRIIIISTVRAQHSLLLHDRKYNLGFVNHDQRFNVAITRAISKLIVVGSPLVLRTDKKWDEYINLCANYGTAFGNLFPPDNQEFREDVLRRTKRFKHIDDQFDHSVPKK